MNTPRPTRPALLLAVLAALPAAAQPLPAGKVADADGNLYGTVTIGGRVWLDANLRATRFRNGELIPFLAAPEAWRAATSAGWCDYEINPQNGTSDGHLYNFHATVDPRGLCPAGFHVPTKEEWESFNSALGGAGASNKRMQQPVSGGGFGAVLAGFRFGNGTGFRGRGEDGALWSSSSSSATDAWHKKVDLSDGFRPGEVLHSAKTLGLAVRCVQDAAAAAPAPAPDPQPPLAPAAPAGKVADADGNLYGTVAIAGRVWLDANLRATRFRNGEFIPFLAAPEAWRAAAGAAWCDYEINPEHGSRDGHLYNFHAVVDPRGLCPAGFHVPSKGEWAAFNVALGGDRASNQRMQQPAASGGFGAVLAGFRYADGSGFRGRGEDGALWSSSSYDAADAWHKKVDRSDDYRPGEILLGAKARALAVRCVQDAAAPAPTPAPAPAAPAGGLASFDTDVLVTNPFLRAASIRPFNQLLELDEAELRTFVFSPDGPIGAVQKKVSPAKNEATYNFDVQGMSATVRFYSNAARGERFARVIFGGKNVDKARAWIDRYVGSPPWQFVETRNENGKPLRVYGARFGQSTFLSLVMTSSSASGYSVVSMSVSEVPR